MIEDARNLPTGEVLAADLCIVGAGAAGIAMALELADSDRTVLLLESGGRQAEPRTQALYAGSVADERLHSPLDRYRQRAFGGSTRIWGGRCTPLDPIDFEARDWIPHSGWPIGPDDLAPYQARAAALCEIGEAVFDARKVFSHGRAMIEGLDIENFDANALERFSCPTDFAARYAHRLAAAERVRVLLHANATEVCLDPGASRVEQLVVRTLENGRFTVRAKDYVLATGGLETPRLLLASRGPGYPRGVGNGHDVVGRYYMCHIAGTIGAVRFGAGRRVNHGYETADDGTYCRRRLALSAEAQREHRLANFVARLHHPRITDPGHRTGALSLLFLAQLFIPWEYRRRLHDDAPVGLRTWMAHLRNVILDLPATIGFAWRLVKGRFLDGRKFPSIVVRPKRGGYSLDFHAEQQPNPESRLTLDSERDALGMPRLRVDWCYTPGDVVSVKCSLALLAGELTAGGYASVEYDEAQVEKEMTRYGAYGGHHIGTARMGRDPRSSVVDPDCRVHGVANLYVAGSAVFPTSSQANPTFPLVALALRLAAHLKAGGNR